MADPTVSLGLHVCGNIAAYVDALNCRKKDIESVRQQNEALRKTLQLASTSLSLLQRDNYAAATTARECLESSKKTLADLETLVASLTACDQPTSSRRSNLKGQGKKLLYPFSRTKVEELGTRIHHANSTLQVAMQTLGLCVTHLHHPPHQVLTIA